MMTTSTGWHSDGNGLTTARGSVVGRGTCGDRRVAVHGQHDGEVPFFVEGAVARERLVGTVSQLAGEGQHPVQGLREQPHG